MSGCVFDVFCLGICKDSVYDLCNEVILWIGSVGSQIMLENYYWLHISTLQIRRYLSWNSFCSTCLNTGCPNRNIIIFMFPASYSHISHSKFWASINGNYFAKSVSRFISVTFSTYWIFMRFFFVNRFEFSRKQFLLSSMAFFSLWTSVNEYALQCYTCSVTIPLSTHIPTIFVEIYITNCF